MFSAYFFVSEPLSIFNKCSPLLSSRCLEIHLCVEAKDAVLPASVSLNVKITFRATAVSRMGPCLQVHVTDVPSLSAGICESSHNSQWNVLDCFTKYMIDSTFRRISVLTHEK